MLLVRRPAEPPEFSERARGARRQVEEAIEAGETPSFEPPVWSDFKPIFVAAQNHKCAFCEALTTAVSTGHVDHFRPKGSVAALEDDPKTWGEEVPGGSNVFGRRTIKALSEIRFQIAFHQSPMLHRISFRAELYEAAVEVARGLLLVICISEFPP